MAENWEIKGRSKAAVIESAVNTAIGMSLLSDVEIRMYPGRHALQHYVALDAIRNGDSAYILCAGEAEAKEMAQDILSEVEWEIQHMPPASMRRAIRMAK